ncbi:MAG: hypothetical protein ACO1TE_08485 [Prosthecobacter sp.]
MKRFCILILVPVLLAACSMPEPVRDIGTLPTGRPGVISRSNDIAGVFSTVSALETLARQHPIRPAFEAAVMEKIRTGEIAANELSVTYEDDTLRSFK